MTDEPQDLGSSADFPGLQFSQPKKKKKQQPRVEIPFSFKMEWFLKLII